MKTVFQARLYGIFIEIKRNLGRKKLHRKIKALVSLEAVLAVEKIWPQSILEENACPSSLEDYFSSMKGRSIFTSITPAY